MSQAALKQKAQKKAEARGIDSKSAKKQINASEKHQKQDKSDAAEKERMDWHQSEHDKHMKEGDRNRAMKHAIHMEHRKQGLGVDDAYNPMAGKPPTAAAKKIHDEMSEKYLGKVTHKTKDGDEHRAHPKAIGHARKEIPSAKQMKEMDSYTHGRAAEDHDFSAHQALKEGRSHQAAFHMSAAHAHKLHAGNFSEKAKKDAHKQIGDSRQHKLHADMLVAEDKHGKDSLQSKRAEKHYHQHMSEGSGPASKMSQRRVEELTPEVEKLKNAAIAEQKKKFDEKRQSMAKSVEEHLENVEKLLGKKSQASNEGLEKGGEGSRGGKVIGHTASGKPIYDHGGEAESYNQQDHKDAREHHMNEQIKHQKEGGNSEMAAHHKEVQLMHLEEGKDKNWTPTGKKKTKRGANKDSDAAKNRAARLQRISMNSESSGFGKN